MAEAIYGMNYSNFIGVDRSSDPRVVARNRLAYSVNMWRDYESEQGAAIETFPGFRKLLGFTDEEIYSIWSLKSSIDEKYLIIHAGESLYNVKIIEYDSKSKKHKMVENPTKVKFEIGMRLTNSDTAFFINNTLFILAGIVFCKVYEKEGELKAEYISIRGGTTFEAYVPTTYYNGQPYEQRNALGNTVYQINTDGGYEDTENNAYVNVPIYERVEYDVSDGVEISGEQILSVEVDGKIFNYTEGNYGAGGVYKIIKREVTLPINGTQGYSEVTLQFLKSDIYNSYSKLNKQIKIKYKAYAVHFNKIGNLTPFKDDQIAMAEAILGCTKSAVYDGRVFLTGNPELPNTVFYSQRNLTGANDPTYFGVYNYFNDGDGNTPNVDLLATPSMLMVIKSDTVQDGSIYYHVGADNPHSDKSVRDLVPRIYPSSTGAAGLGSAGLTDAYSLSCNFLDDPVFLSRRGLEGVTKEQLNAERTVQHRSSTIDRLLIQEDLAHASLAEWKGYLVICCNGHIYLADSRTRTQNAYGSYQYEWFYLEDVGTYEEYTDAYFYTSSEIEVYAENGSPVRLKDIIFNYNAADSSYNTYTDLGFTDEREDRIVGVNEVVKETWGYNNWNQLSAVKIRYVEEGNKKFPVQTTANVKYGGGEFYGAKRVLAVGELLFFATDYDICVFNTDKRGEQIYLKDDKGKDVFDKEGKRILVREVDSDKIDSSWYTFDGVPYISGCSIRLDDCEKKTVTKANVYGTTVARFKMIPGSKCTVKSSINGVNWKKIGEAYISRFNFEDFRFDNTAFTENEDGVFVFPEASRGWVSKQYYFYSDGFCEPFGLYELSYNYKIVGKIRR